MSTQIDAPGDAIEESGPTFPCPDAVWIGPYADVAAITGKRDWLTWIGVTAALSARAHRNIHVHYHVPLQGMGYYLLVSPSSTDKSRATRTCSALLPPDYRRKYSIESGQGLPYLIAEPEHDEKGNVVALRSTPTILLLSEWSVLLQNMDIPGSSLMEKLNECYDSDHPIEVNRTAKKGQSDSVSVVHPTFTMLGATTTFNFRSSVKAHHITSGFINRHFIVPGAFVPWAYDAEGQYFPFDELSRYAAASLPLGHAFGLGAKMADCYTPEARTLNAAWGTSLFEPLHNDIEEQEEASVYKRLHVYSRRLPALLAWASLSPLITVPHVRAAHAAVESSLAFLRYLFSEKPISLTPTMQAYSDLDTTILRIVIAEPDIDKRVLCQRLKRHGGYSIVSQQIEKLVQSGGLTVNMGGERGTKIMLSASASR